MYIMVPWYQIDTQNIESCSELYDTLLIKNMTFLSKNKRQQNNMLIYTKFLTILSFDSDSSK